MENSEQILKLVQMMQDQINLNQDAFGWMATGLKKKVEYKGNTDATKKVQDNLDNLVQYSLLLYLFAMWESYISNELEQQVLTPEEINELKAYKHIRHTGGHGYKGKRADNNRAAFEDKMNSSKPFAGVDLDEENDTLDLKDSRIGEDCKNYMEHLTKQILVRLAGTGATS